MISIVQVAGVIDEQEAQILIDAGVDWLGFPFRLIQNQEDLSEDEAAKIISYLKPPNSGVLITYLTNAREIFALCCKLGVEKVQLHGQIHIGEIKNLKFLAPDFFVIKSLIVGRENKEKLRAAIADCSTYVDAFITDTFDPETGACGATGKSHDWSISRELVESSPLPVILAGGLNPENVGLAIGKVKPAGVDAHTGLEGADGRKNEKLVQDFLHKARAAFTQIIV